VLVGTTGVPTAVLSAPSLVLPGRTFTASGAGSTDPEAACGDRIHSYRFTVDGGAPLETPDPSVTLGPLAPGTHTVTLVVRDTFGNESAPATRSVQVPGLPTAVLDAPATAACGATVTLSGARSTAGPGASVHRYRWDFGDGSPLLETAESSVTHAYATARGYAARLVVVDTVGQESAAAQRTVAVGTTGAPTAVLTTPAIVLDGRTFTASGAGSSDPQSGCGDRIVEYRFTVDGGATIATASSSLTLGPLAPGTHTVTLVVQDSFGNLSSPVTRSLRVDAAPVIAAKGDVVAESKLAPIAVFYTAPAAKDAVDGVVPVTCVAASGAKFASGTTRVICTARDSVGNATNSAFNVVVRLPTTTGAVTKPGDTTKVLEAVTSGQRVRVNAGGFAPGTELSLVFVGADGATRPMGTATAGEDGRFDVRVKLPKRLPRGEGQVTALGTGPDGEEFVRAWLLDVPH
jgi:PKD repeat protein